MSLVQKRFKQNDFLVATKVSAHKISPQDLTRDVLIHTYSNIGNSLRSSRDDEYLYVYHMEKQRPRFKQRKISPDSDQEQVKTVSSRLSESSWTTRLFKIPVAKVKSVTQHARHFVVEMK